MESIELSCYKRCWSHRGEDFYRCSRRCIRLRVFIHRLAYGLYLFGWMGGFVAVFFGVYLLITNHTTTQGINMITTECSKINSTIAPQTNKTPLNTTTCDNRVLTVLILPRL